MASFDELVTEFVTREKVPQHAPRWRTTGHPDYASLSMRVIVDGTPHLRGRVIVTAHRVRLPPKYSFSLLFRRERIMALDVNPGRAHRNLLSGSVSATHWQHWPDMAAIADPRDQTFSVWLHEFLVRANVTCPFGVASPPRGVQLELLNV